MSIRVLTAKVRSGEKSTSQEERKRRLRRAHIIDASGNFDAKYFRVAGKQSKQEEDEDTSGAKVVCES